MKVECIAVAAAFVTGAVAMSTDADKIDASSITAAQLGSLTEQQASTICKLLNLKGLCKAQCKRDLGESSYTEVIEAADGSLTVCKICTLLSGGKTCGEKDSPTPPDESPSPCKPGDTRPSCGTSKPPVPAPCQPGDSRPQCQSSTPPPCQPGDTRPSCGTTPTEPAPCQPGDSRPQCQSSTPPPCQPGDTRPSCGTTPTEPAPCQPGDSRPQCQSSTPPTCQPGDTKPGCGNTPTEPAPCQPGDSRPQCQSTTPPTKPPGYGSGGNTYQKPPPY